MLRETRKRGYSIAVQTYAEWMGAAAAAVHNPSTGEVGGAVVIAGPHLRLTEARIAELAPLLTNAARELATAIVASPSLSKPRNGSFFISRAS